MFGTLGAGGSGRSYHPVVITGNSLNVGDTLTCTTPGLTDVTAYQWMRDDVPIDGETASTYIIQTADGGHAITCAATGTPVASAAVAIQAVLSQPFSLPLFIMGY